MDSRFRISDIRRSLACVGLEKRYSGEGVCGVGSH